LVRVGLFDRVVTAMGWSRAFVSLALVGGLCVIGLGCNGGSNIPLGGSGGDGGGGGGAGTGGTGGVAGTGGIGGGAGTGGIGGGAGTGGIGGSAGTGGIGGGGGCPAGANTSESVSLMVTTGRVLSYEVATAGLLVTPGLGAGSLFGDAIVGMGTDAVGNPRSIIQGAVIGDPNESMVFQIFRSDGLNLGVPEGATDVTLFVNGSSSTSFLLTAENKDGLSLGSATTTIGTKTVDVSTMLPGEIHKLTIEATGAAVILIGIAYTNVCLGYTPPAP
jgi:hypothetical protein